MTMTEQDVLNQSQTDVIARKFKNNPFLFVGVTGFLVSAMIGAYKYKSRPKGMSTASFLVQLRVIAQSVVVGSLTIGMAYGMINEYVFKNKPKRDH